MDKILSNKKGEKIILLGNDAVVRGALEAGVGFVSTYPGTPASEIGNTFFRIHKEAGVTFEFSTNEKVAMEAGVGAAFSGLKVLVAMKNFGLNVAVEALLPAMYTGVKGSLVLMIADDASCWSSAQSEENTRPYIYLAHIPTLEPSNPQECKEFTKLAFELSDKFKMPIMVRLTTRVSHQQQAITIDEIKKPNTKGKFVKDVHQFVTMPPRVLEMKKELLDKVDKVQELVEKSEINRIIAGKDKTMGIITSGVSYLYVKEALKELELDIPVFKVGFFYPLPEDKLKKFLKPLKKVLVVEELEPYLEKEINILAKNVNCDLEVHGLDLVPQIGELRPEIVLNAIGKFAGKKVSISESKAVALAPKRKPQLCPACPYRMLFTAVKEAVDEKEVIFGGDIGCYMLAGGEPYRLQDFLMCMGASIGISHGIKKATGQKLITFIGDSTFFHAGLPELVNTVFNQSNPLIIIMNNSTTAMTGHQPHPDAPPEWCHRIKIEEVVKSLGVTNMKIVDPLEKDEMVKTIKEFINNKEVSVIISRRPCVFVKK
jgi:indolepyruvate ferredoxin oxidoreductase alpha subunit